MMKTQKLVVIVLPALALGAFLTGYWTAQKEKQRSLQLLSTELPMEQAIREVEVSIWETANSLFCYTAIPSDISRNEYQKQQKDIKKFMGIYKTLAETEQERQAAAKFEKDWADTVAQAEEIFALRDQIADLQQKIWDSIYRGQACTKQIVNLILMESNAPDTPKSRSLRKVENNVWKAFNALNYYLNQPSRQTEREIERSLTNVEDFWESFKNFDSTPKTEPYAQKFEQEWATSSRLIRQCHALASELCRQSIAFNDSVHAVDDMIDFDIQEKLLNNRIAKLKEESDDHLP